MILRLLRSIFMKYLSTFFFPLLTSPGPASNPTMSQHENGRHIFASARRIRSWQRSLPCFIFLFSFLPFVQPIGAEAGPPSVPVPEYSVVVDAGHGGAIVRRKDDRWDPISRKYLSSFLPGTQYTKYTEHELMLELALRVHHYLQLTQTDAGWKKFEALLKQFSPQQKFVRIKFNSYLSRKDGWKDRSLPASHPDVNAPYRLYDYPDRKTGRIQKGRISKINDQEPYLVLSLHLNPAPPGKPLICCERYL